MPSLSRFRCFSLQTALLAVLLVSPATAEDAQPISEKEFRTLFAKLGSDRFEVRHSTQARLEKMATKHQDLVLAKVLDAYFLALDPEIRYRLRTTMFAIVAENVRGEGFIGIRMMDAFPQRFIDPGLKGGAPQLIQPQEKAVQIISVLPGTAGQEAGLRPGDHILKLDDNDFRNDAAAAPAYIQLSDYIRSKREGASVKMTIRRVREILEVEVKLGARPEEHIGERREQAFTEWFQKELAKREGTVTTE